MRCIADSLNRYGPPKELASLTIRGPAILATWLGKRDPSDPLASYKREQILSYSATTSTTSEFASALTADFTPDPLREETLGISIGDELLLLATILDDEAVRPHKRDGAVYGVRRARVIGLVLAFDVAFPSSSQGGDQAAKQPVYRRVGLFSAEANWSSGQRTRTVVIM